MRILVFGFWERNIGDDLFLLSLCEICKSLNINTKAITILATKENKMYYESFGVSVIVKNTLLFKIKNRISIIFRGSEYFYTKFPKNVFMMLGGSLFVEDKSIENEKQQIKNLTFAVRNAKKSYVIGSNFGPYKTEWFFDNYYKLFSNCTSVNFRDKYSKELFRDLNNVKFAPDVVLEGKWDIFPNSYECDSQIVLSVINLENRPSLKKYKKKYEDFLESIVRYHVDHGDNVSLVSFCKDQGDEIVCNKIKNNIDSDRVNIHSYSNIEDTINLFRKANKIYATRFHAMILALYFGIACVPIVYDTKTLHALESYCSTYEYVDIQHLEENQYLWAVQKNTSFSAVENLTHQDKQFKSFYNDMKRIKE